MDSWIFEIARKVCVIAFGANIFIHAIIGASTVDGIIKGTLSMAIMLILLIVLSKQDLKNKVGKNKKKRHKHKDHEIVHKGVTENE